MRRVPQPPVDALRRDPERHDFWPGFVVTMVGALSLACGFWHATGVETTEGGTAWEHELVRSFTGGGLQVVTPEAPPDPASFADPGAAASAMARYERRSGRDDGSGLRYRVNPSAQTPCPT